MKARLGAGRANLQRADNQINRHDVAGVPDDRAQVKHLVELEPAGDGVRLAQRKAYRAGDDEEDVRIIDAAQHDVQPSAQSRLAIAECIHGDDLALDRLQCGLGLAVARLRGPVSGRCTVQCGGVGACAGFLTRGCGRHNCCGGSHGSSRWRADGNAHTDHLAMAGDALPATNLRCRNLV